MKNYQLQLLEEMEILWMILESSTDVHQQDSIIKMLCELVHYVDSDKIA